MTEQEREMDLQIAEFLSEIKHLKKVEQAAMVVVKSFSNSIDYNTLDKSLDSLEAARKEKPRHKMKS
jgi:hypothetical protein